MNPPPATPDAVERALQEAAVRILDGLTRLLHENPGTKYIIDLEPSGRVRLTIEDPLACINFTGGSVQDACAQAVNTLHAGWSIP